MSFATLPSDFVQVERTVMKMYGEILSCNSILPCRKLLSLMSGRPLVKRMCFYRRKYERHYNL